MISRSSGGYGAISVADSLKDYYGIIPLQVLASAPPLKIGSWVPMGFIRSQMNGIFSPISSFSIAVATLPFANTRPGIPNYNTSQSFLNATRTGSLLDMFTDPNLPSIGDFSAFMGYVMLNYPLNLSDFAYLSDFVYGFFEEALVNNVTDPCSNMTMVQNFEVDKLCEAIAENDLSSTVDEADFPIDMCISEDDTIIVVENIPEDKLKFLLSGPDHGPSMAICEAKLFGSSQIQKPEIRATKAPKGPKAAKKAKKASKMPKTKKGIKAPKLKKGTKGGKQRA